MIPVAALAAVLVVALSAGAGGSTAPSSWAAQGIGGASQPDDGAARGGGASGGAQPEDAGRSAEPAPPAPSASASPPPQPEPAPDSVALPPEQPDEANPVVSEEPPEAEPGTREDQTWTFVRTLLGLVFLFALAYAGGHPRVHALERRLGVTQVVTAGFPFVVLGVIARLPAVGVLSDSVLSSLGPVLRVALGWVGFLIGFRFDARRTLDAPPGTSAFVAWRGVVALLVIAMSCGSLLVVTKGIDGTPLVGAVLLRDALILGVAGALTSRSTVRLLQDRGGSERATHEVDHVLRLEELLGILGLLVIAAYFRPQGTDVTWQLPGTAWMLLTLGAGLAMGFLALAVMTRAARGGAESLVLLLGVVAFAAGLASNLRLSPVVVCFLAGLVMSNAPGVDKNAIRTTLMPIERPIYLLFLLVAGALWDVRDGFGWLLMGIFVASRLLGKWLGTAVGSGTQGYPLQAEARRSLVLAPMGALSIAVVVNAQLLYPSGAISWTVAAIVGGAIFTEVIVQLSLSRRGSPSRPSLPPSSSLPGAGP